MKATTNGVLGAFYGPSKTGKTVCTGAAGACGLFIARGGGLLSIRHFLGLDDLNVKPAETVEAASKIVKEAAGKHQTIVIDDFSLLVEETIIQLEKVHSFGDMWRSLRRQVLEMRDIARAATEKGTHVLFNCHESPPRTSSGKFVRGGPALPGQLPEQFSAFMDVVARVVHDETAAPWKFVLSTVADSKIIAGDRLAIFPPQSPMNLAEALRAAGYDIPRPKKLAWQENAVAGLSEKVQEAGIENWKTVLKPAAAQLMSKHPPAHVRWAIEDSLHRAIFRSSKNSFVDALFDEQDEETW